MRTSSRNSHRIGFDCNLLCELAPLITSGIEAKLISRVVLACRSVGNSSATASQFSSVGINLVLANVLASSCAAMTHMAGPGSCAMHHAARVITIWVLPDWALHIMAKSLHRLSAKHSIGSLVQGAMLASNLPGKGDVLSTTIFFSAHLHGGSVLRGAIARRAILSTVVVSICRPPELRMPLQWLRVV